MKSDTTQIIKETAVFSIILVKQLVILVEILCDYEFGIINACLIMQNIYEIKNIICMIKFEFKNLRDLNKFVSFSLNMNAVFIAIVSYYQTRDFFQLKLILLNIFSFVILSFLLTTKTYYVYNKDIERYGNNCVVCLDKMTLCGNHKLKKLSCNHVFHADCIEKCLEVSNKCPTCRKNLL
jgi:hypothetical protein